MTPTIAIANHKGGSGKTTTTYYLGMALADMDYSVLLIDLDDQATLTARLTPHSTTSTPIDTIADVLDGLPIENAIISHSKELEYIPSDYKLAWMAARMQASSPNHAFLRRSLAGLENAGAEYDFILLDCPPSASILLINALAAATHIIIPSMPTEESYAGVLRMEAMIADISSVLDHPIHLLGNIITMVSPSSLNEKIYISALSGASLGSVPRRVSVIADQHLRSSYADIAEILIKRLEANHA